MPFSIEIDGQTVTGRLHHILPDGSQDIPTFFHINVYEAQRGGWYSWGQLVRYSSPDQYIWSWREFPDKAEELSWYVISWFQ